MILFEVCGLLELVNQNKLNNNLVMKKFQNSCENVERTLQMVLVSLWY